MGAESQKGGGGSVLQSDNVYCCRRRADLCEVGNTKYTVSAPRFNWVPSLLQTVGSSQGGAGAGSTPRAEGLYTVLARTATTCCLCQRVLNEAKAYLSGAFVVSWCHLTQNNPHNETRMEDTFSLQSSFLIMFVHVAGPTI